MYTAIRCENFPTFYEYFIETAINDLVFNITSRNVSRAVGIIKRPFAEEKSILEKLGYIYHYPEVVPWGEVKARLNLSIKEVQYASNLLNVTQKSLGLTYISKDIKGTVSGILYLLLKGADKKTQTEIARALNITEVTLRTRAKQLLDKKLIAKAINYYNSLLRAET
ncbi:Uncharacterised protein [Candidatus Tiddalikarchaeum anstoanum]|nr:Uncharacterised protein [Candidatus Tiddalikarchaeum anstoanum]